MIRGVGGSEKRADEFVGDRRSVEDNEDPDRAEKRECGCCILRGKRYRLGRRHYHVRWLSSPLMTGRPIPASPPGGRVLHSSFSMPDFSATPKSESSRRALRPPTSPGSPSSVDLQQHIYNSLLESRTADISLHVKGTWEAVYKLHRVVLIQSVSTSIQRLSS